MRKVTFVETKSNYILSLTFDDGVTGDVSIAGRLFGSMFEPLKDEKFFSKASVDEFGVVFWPNDVDLDTNTLYEQIKSQN